MPDSFDRALVLFSGGQDSTTCLAWALDRFQSVETVGFAYGQRHAVELDCRPVLRDGLARRCAAWRDKLGAHHRIDLGVIAQQSESALTGEAAIAMGAEGLPTSFVPGRNLMFLTSAAMLAYRRGIRHLVAGMCETDYSGYPDCRDDTLKALQVALNLGMNRRFVLHTPLMWIDKAGTFALAETIGGKPMLDLVIEATHSCYLGDRTHRHDWGYGCGACPACKLRADGFARFVQERR
jgi:7-cyano-7-deazaguanine synthase